MDIRLEISTEDDAPLLYKMQKKAFLPLLEKYQDEDTNPANESIDRVLTRINNPLGHFYKILSKNTVVGAICIVQEEDLPHFWISPMFILPDYQGKGIAQMALKSLEETISHAEKWKLATIIEEQGNVYLYEKMGYKQIGSKKKINDRTTLAYFEKQI